MNKLQTLYLYLAWVISCCIFLGSLYFSEIKHMVPCSLCWYQRIALFPLVILLGIALYKNESHIVSYAYPFPFFAIALSGYQVLIQEFAYFAPLHVCSQDAVGSCFIKEPISLGFVTLPMLAFTSSCALGFLLWMVKKNGCRKEE
jgi:disulfide bond formation protein DsbB